MHDLFGFCVSARLCKRQHGKGPSTAKVNMFVASGEFISDYIQIVCIICLSHTPGWPRCIRCILRPTHRFRLFPCLKSQTVCVCVCVCVDHFLLLFNGTVVFQCVPSWGMPSVKKYQWSNPIPTIHLIFPSCSACSHILSQFSMLITHVNSHIHTCMGS